MKVLYIGGTGNISTASSQLALAKGIELWHLNRGKTASTVNGVKNIVCDINDPDQARHLLAGHEWDCVVNWIAFTPEQVKRDLELFRNRTRQYIFISSASCYQTPLLNPIITERTPLSNPLWQYSRDKIACEEVLMSAFTENGFPATIVRPSHTYSNVIPIPLGGWTEYTTVARIKKGLPIVVPGDGSSLWVLTHAEDFAKGFNGLLGNSDAIGEAVHITSDEVLTWNQIHQELSEAVGAEAKIVHVTSDKICRFDSQYVGSLLGDKSGSVIFDNSKIRRLVPDFKAAIGYADGIKRVIDWFEADPVRQVVNPADDAFIDRLIASELKD